MEKAAEAVAELAVNSAALLTEGDPLHLIAPLVEALEHTSLIQAATLLLQRFRDTVLGQLPSLEPLAAAVGQSMLPVLSRLEKCIAAHRTFQSAASLTPLLNRVVVLAAQSCALAVRDVCEAGAILTLTHALTTFAEVLAEAVLDRIEHYRPLDAARISWVHQSFGNYQAEVLHALEGKLSGDVASCRLLAPPPERLQHRWKNEEMRQLWEVRCAPVWEAAVPIDGLALLLLRAAALEATLPHREAVMRRLSNLELKDVGFVAAQELDSCSAEVRRCGGLRAWVNAVVLSGGSEAARPAPPAAPCAPVAGKQRLASTWGGPAVATTGRTAGAATWGASTMPASTRLTPRGGVGEGARRPFALSSSLGRRSAASSEGGYANPLQSSVERGLLGASQRLVLGEKAAVDPRHSTTGETPLHAAAAQDRRHAPLASLLLERGADANAEDRNLVTPLHIAASSGHSEVTRKLVKCGANVCKEDRWNVTPLHRAADNGQAEVVDILLRSGAGAGAVDEWGATPLHRAAARGQLAVAEKLLRNGAVDVNAEDRKGDRPMHLAAARGDYALVKMLLEHGGGATLRSRLAGKTPEDCARERGHADVVTLLSHRHEWVTPRSQAVVAA